LCSAEPLSDAKREKLSRQWGAQVRDTFGMTEAGMMGAEDNAGRGFRIWTDMFMVEVLDPETYAPMAEGKVGYLVVTPLWTNNVTPFLRWSSGDLVTWQRGDDDSGPFSVFPLIKHAHRTSGFFKVRGVNINHGEFEDFVFALAAVNDFKCEAVTLGDLDALRVSIEVKRGADIAATVALVQREVKRVFEIAPIVEALEPGALAREFDQMAERLKDLVEGQRGIIEQPDGSRLGHQRCVAHGKSPLCFAHLFWRRSRGHQR